MSTLSSDEKPEKLVLGAGAYYTVRRSLSLSLAFMGALSGSSPIQASGFSCSGATFPDEIAICNDPHLSDLDRMISTAYAQAEANSTGLGVFSAKRQFLRDRGNCGGDTQCIMRAQVAILEVFRRLGASVEIPVWARSSPPHTTALKSAVLPKRNGLAESVPHAADVPLSAQTEAFENKAAVPFAVQRAALLIAPPESISNFRTYVGYVEWVRRHSSGFDNNEIAGIAAHVVVPDISLEATISLGDGKSEELDASHLIRIDIDPSIGSTLGDVIKIGMPQMRNDAEMTGHTLIGSMVTVADNHFLVGLTNDTSSLNAQLLAGYRWVDVPLLFRWGLNGKLTVERPL